MFLGTLSLAGAVVAAILWGCAFTWVIQKLMDKASAGVVRATLGAYCLGAMFLAGIAWPWFTALQATGGEELLHKLTILFSVVCTVICWWSVLSGHRFTRKGNSMKSGAVFTLGVLCGGLSMLASVSAGTF